MKLTGGGRARRGVNLTPMVDVVFLLLFFFMLASRFSAEEGLPLALAGGAADWTGPPRLVEVAPDGLTLNGLPVAPDALPGALDRLMDSRAEPVVIAARAGAVTGDLVGALDALAIAGFTSLVIAE